MDPACPQNRQNGQQKGFVGRYKRRNERTGIVNIGKYNLQNMQRHIVLDF